MDGAARGPSEELREHAEEKVFRELQQEALFWCCKQAVKEEIIKPSCDVSKVRGTIARMLQTGGLQVAVKNFAYERLRELRKQQQQVARLQHPQFPLPPIPVPLSSVCTLDVVEWARRRWAEVTFARLRELSHEQRQPFLRPRNAPGGQGASGGAADEEEVTTHYIVDLDDLYTLVTQEMNDRAHAGEGGLLGRGLQWSVLGVHLHAPTPEELRERFHDLSPERGHLGVPDGSAVHGSIRVIDALTERRNLEGQQLLEKPYIPHLQHFSRFGVPPALRLEIWGRSLNAAGEQMTNTLVDVARGVGLWEWLTDDVLRLDVAEHCANDKNYFPFDEIVEAMVLALSRDPEIASDCECGPPQLPLLVGSEAPPGNALEASDGQGGAELVPPCGVVPFRGFSYYACPFAFLSDRLEATYPLFRAVYCRYLSKLHTISCQPGTLLPLCALFESLVFTVAPHVAFHLVQMGPDAAPLKMAFPWIVHGFVGFLRADQVLWLWDRVLGFESTELIAVLAAAVFVFRARLVLSARVPEDVALVFSDISALQALPLLQHLLFADDLGGHFEL
mmetsp:Transcript_100371/g.189357  ORF Transcript_100371/g.189357 Transcript_100371/m.189357 type:complete len:562 (-) Transcript_100371:28-1713(-)